MRRIAIVFLLSACSSTPSTPVAKPTPPPDPPFVRLLNPSPGELLDQVVFGQAADGRVFPDASKWPDDRLTGATSATGGYFALTVFGTTSSSSWSCATVAGALLCKGDGVFGTIPSGMCFDNDTCSGSWCSNRQPTTHACVPGWTAMPDLPPMVQVVDSCALSDAGEVFCWDGRAAPDLGPGPRPVSRVAFPKRVTKLAGGFAILEGGELRTFDGQAVGLTNVVDACGGLGAGFQTACALGTDGIVHCWGDNHYGAVGDGTTIYRASPVDIGRGFAGIACGSDTGCGLRADATVACWGLETGLVPTTVSGLGRVVQVGRVYSGSLMALQDDGRVLSVNLGTPPRVHIIH